MTRLVPDFTCALKVCPLPSIFPRAKCTFRRCYLAERCFRFGGRRGRGEDRRQQHHRHSRPHDPPYRVNSHLISLLVPSVGRHRHAFGLDQKSRIVSSPHGVCRCCDVPRNGGYEVTHWSPRKEGVRSSRRSAASSSIPQIPRERPIRRTTDRRRRATAWRLTPSAAAAEETLRSATK